MYIYDSSIDNLNTDVLDVSNNLFIENQLDISYIITLNDLSTVDFRLNNFSDLCFNYPNAKGIDYINNPDISYSNLVFNYLTISGDISLNNVTTKDLSINNNLIVSGNLSCSGNVLIDLSLITNNLFGDQDLIAGNFEGTGIVIKTTIVNNLLSVSGSEDSYAGEFTTGDIPSNETLFSLYRAILDSNMQVNIDTTSSKSIEEILAESTNSRLKPSYLQLLNSEDEPEPETEENYALIHATTEPVYEPIAEPSIWDDNMNIEINGMFYYVDEDNRGGQWWILI